MKLYFFVGLLLIMNSVKAQIPGPLSDINPIHFNDDFSGYDQKTAIYMAQLSELSYAKDNFDRLRFLEQYKLEFPQDSLHYEFIQAKSFGTNTQLLLWAVSGRLIIAFRGTKPGFRNFLTDAKFKIYCSNAIARKHFSNLPDGHGGFRRVIMNLIDDKDIFNRIEQFIKKAYPQKISKEIPTYITGHSLGAGIGSLFAYCLKHNNYNVKGMYFFAPPLAVACYEVEKLDPELRRSTYDIVNYLDYVPRAGLRGSLRHYGKFYRICNDFTLAKQNEKYITFPSGEGKREIHYHSLVSHLRALALSKNSTEKVRTRELDCFPTYAEMPLCTEKK